MTGGWGLAGQAVVLGLAVQAFAAARRERDDRDDQREQAGADDDPAEVVILAGVGAAGVGRRGLLRRRACGRRGGSDCLGGRRQLVDGRVGAFAADEDGVVG